MHPRERLLGQVSLYKKRKQPIPLDLLAKADNLGISLELLGENTNLPNLTEEGDFEYVQTEDDIHNHQGNSSIPLAKQT